MKALSSCQWEIHQGTKPATNPGAAKKTAEPMIANTFLVMASCKQVPFPS